MNPKLRTALVAHTMMLALAASAERDATHPVGQVIYNTALDRRLRIQPVRGVDLEVDDGDDTDDDTLIELALTQAMIGVVDDTDLDIIEVDADGDPI